MFKKIALSSVILICNVAFADCIGPEIMGKCYGTQTSTSSSNSGYQGSSGNKYQYDLSKPMDRIGYDTDPSAQIRDKLNVNPTRSLDFNMGQNGGGIYDDY